MENKFSYEIGDRVLVTHGYLAGLEGTVRRTSPSSSSHYYGVQLDGKRFPSVIHYFDLKRIDV